MNKNESKYFNCCEKAGVNRSTFYLHYETLGDLLSESVEYVNEQFFAYMKQDTDVFCVYADIRALSGA